MAILLSFSPRLTSSRTQSIDILFVLPVGYGYIVDCPLFSRGKQPFTKQLDAGGDHLFKIPDWSYFIQIFIFHHHTTFLPNKDCLSGTCMSFKPVIVKFAFYIT